MGLFSYLVAEFETPRDMLGAARQVRALGFDDLDGYSPYPLPEAKDALGLPRSRVPLFCLIGGLTGATFGYLMMWWCNAVDYPINVGGRPLNSLPAWVPIMFELAVLFAALATFFSFLGLTGLPRPYHPTFRVPQFRSASNDRFWLSIRVEGTEAPSTIKSVLSDHRAVVVTTLEEHEH